MFYYKLIKLFFLFVFIYFGLLVILVYGTTQITEINFQNPEFIEIYSNESLNISNSYMYDDYGISKNISLSLIKKSNSNFYLIISDLFLTKFNQFNLNATILSVNKNSLGYRGLKNNGENFTIIFPYNNTTLNWQNDVFYTFATNESLNYNIGSNSSYKSPLSPGYIRNITLNNLSISNQTNISFNFNNISNNSNSNLDFQIKSDLIFTNKLKFKFITNLTNYSIKYWIGDYFNNTIKSTRTTNNQNFKYFTCKLNSSSIIFIKAKLTDLTSNNSIKKSKFVFFQKIIPKKNTSILNTTPNIFENKFDIITSSIIFKDTLKFKFKTNLLNYSIKYWIEDMQGNKIKSNQSTKNSGYKQFTPKLKYSSFLNICANLYDSSNTLISSKNKSVLLFKEIINNNNNTNLINNDFSNLSKIIILSKNISNSLNYNLKFNVINYYYNNSKVDLFLNSKDIFSFNINKNSNIDFNLPITLNFNLSVNQIKINGLNQSIILNISILNSTKISKNNLPKLNSKFQINNLSIFNNSNSSKLILFNINSSYKNLSGICYVLNKKTIISSLFNLSNQKDLINISLNLNLSRFKVIVHDNIELKLLCKYKYNFIKNLKYTSLLFNLSLNNHYKNKTNLVYTNLNNSNFLLNINTTKTLSKLDNQYSSSFISSNNIHINTNSSIPIYLSDNEKNKKNSFYFLFIALFILIIPLILLW